MLPEKYFHRLQMIIKIDPSTNQKSGFVQGRDRMLIQLDIQDFITTWRNNSFRDMGGSPPKTALQLIAPSSLHLDILSHFILSMSAEFPLD